MTPKLARFQFTIARLLGCTTLLAIAMWVVMAHPGIPATISLTIGTAWKSGTPIWTFWQPFIVAALIGSAFGVLADGKTGAAEGFKAGCAISLHVFIVVFMTVVAYQLFFH